MCIIYLDSSNGIFQKPLDASSIKNIRDPSSLLMISSILGILYDCGFITLFKFWGSKHILNP
jgi:hypothetical protein